MKYSGSVCGSQTEIAIEREGIRLGDSFLNYADFKTIRPINHRVYVDTLDGEETEISMLGFSYDGFLEELCGSFSDRSIEALFADEKPIMRCEGEYILPDSQGRGTVILLPDAVCVAPPTDRAIRIPLCFTSEIAVEGYLLRITMRSGERYTVGRMGYDTMPFAERTQKCADLTKKKRAQAVSRLKITPPYTHCGLFRTEQPELYWLAAVKDGRCAIELFTGDDSATYLYSFSEPEKLFMENVEAATEAMGVNREIIYLSEQQLQEKPLYRMSVARSEAVRFLRSKSCGRLIHNASHSQRLSDFLNGK